MRKFFVYKTIPLEQINQLVNIEPKLAHLLDLSKPFTVRIMPNHYHCIIHSIISQQLTSAAVDSIWHKLVFNFPKMDEHSIAKSSIEQLNTIGLSPQKASLIKKITYAIIDKKINLKKMEKMDNQAIHDVLIEYKYLGEWTIAMILIFTYFRTDILPITDFGIRKGLCKLYQQEKISDVFIDKLRERLGNYATLFSFCLWRINQNV